ncbi:MAG: SDR family oxidoreductase [Clostridiales Family XIII bacterium]|nr:SDR family oxidoreductase [Clostridiales Family XIII bacterium]
MKYALVTGSTRGIGACIADTLAMNGYTVFRNGRTGGDFPADLSALEGVNALADALASRAYKLDCLVLNTAATYRKPIQEIDYEHWRMIMDTNVNMPFFLIQRLLDHIAYGGSILFIGAMLSLKPHATSIPYGVSKAAVNMLAQSLVKVFASREIRVNVLCPGFVDTESQQSKPEKLRARIENKIALKRFATEQEVADMCLSIINNSYINGAIVNLDGGYDME